MRVAFLRPVPFPFPLRGEGGVRPSFFPGAVTGGANVNRSRSERTTPQATASRLAFRPAGWDNGTARRVYRG